MCRGHGTIHGRPRNSAKKKKGGPSQESPPLVIMLIGATTGYGKRGTVVPVQIAALSGFASCDCPSNVSVPPSGSRVTIVESLP